MDDRALIISNDGIGGQLLAAQCAHYIRTVGQKHVYFAALSRDEVFRPLKYLLEDKYLMVQLDPDDESKISDDSYVGNLASKYMCDDAYVCWPDLLFRNRYSFDLEKYYTTFSVLKQMRVLTHRFFPDKKHVYINLFSSTPGYLYSDIPNLIANLADKLPDFTFHVPWLDKWAGKDISMGELPSYMPANVIVYKNPDIIEQINIASGCGYGIYTDNGFSHIAYHFGQNRLLLDPQFGNPMFISRWRENNLDDSVPIQLTMEQIYKIVKDNLTIPQSLLVPRTMCLAINDYNRELLFKC